MHYSVLCGFGTPSIMSIYVQEVVMLSFAYQIKAAFIDSYATLVHIFV